ncbi:hypothetical protein VNI00_009413 [Paramarasmius palmivorus]|uniref:Uncharacterized protein n=1 Tax=Paramarasmius palmivorus TaxID=297713 RepID=A0AAW0CQG2_9AGAR
MFLARLKRVSRGVRNEVVFYEQVYFGLGKLYGAFFHSQDAIAEFRRLQLLTGALVSGSAVVSYLSRARFRPSDLDVFVGKQWALLVGQFLMKQGYSFVPLTTVFIRKRLRSEAQPSTFVEAITDEFMKARPNTGTVADRYEMCGIAGVFNFCKKGGPKVQIVAVCQEPIAVILGFYSTLVLNVATATEVVSLYPWTSFVEHRALYLKRDTLAVEAARFKYERRGWRSLSMLTAQLYLGCDSELSTKIRWFGDGHSWVVRFTPLKGMPNASRLYDSLAVTSWSLRCLDPEHVCLSVSRLDREYFARSYFVHPSAEHAVRDHPCFENPQCRVVLLEDPVTEDVVGPDVRGGSLHALDSTCSATPASSATFGSEEAPSDALTFASAGRGGLDVPPVSDMTSSTLMESDDPSESGSDTSIVFSEYVSSDMVVAFGVRLLLIFCGSTSWGSQDVWYYTHGFNGCTHIDPVPPYSPDAVVVDYLKGLYPLMEAAHRRGVVMEKLRHAFERSKECCPVGQLASHSPSAFLVSAILRCLNDVAWSGLWEEDEVDFDVTFQYDTAVAAVRTVCVFHVPVQDLETVRRDTIDWRVWAEEWDECRLAVHVAALTP